MFFAANPSTQPRHLPPIDLPTRPDGGRTGAVLYHLLGRGLSPEGPLPMRTWMLLNGVDDVEDHAGLRRIFIGQLGPEWHGFSSAGVVTKVLLLRVAAAFLDNAVFVEMDDMLGEIMSRSPDVPKDMRTVESVVRRFSARIDIVEWIDRFGHFHGFERTLLLGMTQWVIHKKGVLPLRAPHLPWLPYLDRASWLGLQFLGLRVFTAEVAGMFAHMQSEKTVRNAIPIPDVDAAIAGAVAAWRGRQLVVIETRPGRNLCRLAG
jgi:hypothetical protein